MFPRSESDSIFGRTHTPNPSVNSIILSSYTAPSTLKEDQQRVQHVEERKRQLKSSRKSSRVSSEVQGSVLKGPRKKSVTFFDSNNSKVAPSPSGSDEDKQVVMKNPSDEVFSKDRETRENVLNRLNNPLPSSHSHEQVGNVVLQFNAARLNTTPLFAPKEQKQDAPITTQATQQQVQSSRTKKGLTFSHCICQ